MIVFLETIVYNGNIGDDMIKKNKFILLVILVISILLIIAICSLLLKTTGKINQGSFRVTDAVIESTLNVIEKQEEQVDALSNMVLDLSQENQFELLVTKDVEITKATIDQIKINYPLKLGTFRFGQLGKELLDTIDEKTIIEIDPEEKLEQYSMTFHIVNENCMTDVNVPNQTNVVTFDGTILELLNQNLDDLKFDLSFCLNLYDEAGNKNVCKIKLTLPDDALLKDGISLIREDPSKYLFEVKR